MIYLDNNATTKPLDEVPEAVRDVLVSVYGNPSSAHKFGHEARRLVEKARDDIAEMIGSEYPKEIVFTSGATESICHAFRIGYETFEKKDFRIIISAVEHPAVIKNAEYYRNLGAKLEIIEVDNLGNLDLGRLENAIKKGKAFVSIMYVNNETGVINPIDKISSLCKTNNCIFHVDAVQAVGKLPVKVRSLGCDLLSISGHKFHGPKGIGALFVRNGLRKSAIIFGHQEEGLRGGTENVPGIVGMGVAAKSVTKNLSADIKKIRDLRDKFEFELFKEIPDIKVNGHVENRVCNTTNIYFPGKNAANILQNLSINGVYASAGAACSTGGKLSHVLKAMGFSEERINGSIRFSFSKFNTLDEVKTAVRIIKEVVSNCVNCYQFI